MALNFAILKQLTSQIKAGDKVASFGYPDITVSPQQMEMLIGPKVIGYRADSEAICKRHGISPARDIPDADSVFQALGTQLDVFDIIQERGNEYLCDLNYPWSENNYDTNHNDLGKYNYVLDVGTMEHCFNIGQAMMNMASMVKEGGMIFHENPFIMPNHGFWCPNPTLYADFYEQNGFEMIACSICFGGLKNPRFEDVPINTRFNLTGEFESTTILAAAKRVEIKPFVFPVQRKYKAILAAAGNRAREV